jgi:cell division protein FtsB
MKSRNRSAWQSVLSSPVTLIIAIILAIILFRAVWNIHQKAAMAADKLDQANADLAKLEADKADLESRVGDLSTDAGLKAAIREKYHAVEPGEQVAVIVDPSHQMGSDSQSAATDAPAAGSALFPETRGYSWWQKLLRMIGL